MKHHHHRHLQQQRRRRNHNLRLSRLTIRLLLFLGLLTLVVLFVGTSKAAIRQLNNFPLSTDYLAWWNDKTMSRLQEEQQQRLATSMHDEASRGGLASSVWMEKSKDYPKFGNLQNLTCVCGCVDESNSNTTNSGAVSSPSQVYCALSEKNLPVWCVVHQGYLYASDKPLWTTGNSAPFGTKAPRIPLLVILCDAADGYQHFLTPAVWRQSHSHFGIAFDHITEHRVIHISPSSLSSSLLLSTPQQVQDSTTNINNNNNEEISIPSTFLWHGSTRGGWQPWKPIHNDTDTSNSHSNNKTTTSQQRAPQLHGATVAFLESGDCWTHGLAVTDDPTTVKGINPWHCVAGMLNWGILSRLFAQYPRQLLHLHTYGPHMTRFFAWQGMDEFFHLGEPTLTSTGNELVGQADLRLLAGKGVETSMHDDDHKVREALVSDKTGKAGYRVELQGRIPRAILNMAPGRSLLWSNENFVGKYYGEPNQIIMEYRNQLLEEHLKTFQGLFPNHHPIQVLRTNFSEYCRWILPEGDDNATQLVRDAMEAEISNYNEQTWKMDLLSPPVILIWRRSAMNATTINSNTCSRCIENVNAMAQKVSDATGMPVVLLHPTLAVPVSLQMYILYACQVVLAMHGGAWGLAYGLSPRQAAVEILPHGQQLTFQHMVDMGKPVYRKVACPTCRPTGPVNVDEVIRNVRDALAELKARANATTTASTAESMV